MSCYCLPQSCLLLRFETLRVSCLITYLLFCTTKNILNLYLHSRTWSFSKTNHNKLMYHYPNHQFYHQSAYQQQCPVFIDNTKHSAAIAGTQIPCETVQHALKDTQPRTVETYSKKETNTVKSVKKKANIKNSRVDTSSYSIEERLVAAVWVHERKNTKSSMSQVKHDFRQRFAREPPTKNTLLVWERKLFSTGSVHDAPRAGRPVSRNSRTAEVAESVRCAPALSLRARARALRLPRTTLRTILCTDLRQRTTTLTDKRQTKTIVKTTQQEVDVDKSASGEIRSGYS